MAARASFQKDFKVQETKGKAAEGPNSLLAINNRIAETTLEEFENNPKARERVFDAMQTLCLVCANQRKLIAKVRGDSNDFLRYATMNYVARWKKQFAEKDARRPVDQIQNWIPYILGTIRFALITYNKEVWDYDFLGLPILLEDQEDSIGNQRDLQDYTAKNPLTILSLEALTHRETLHSVLLSLPAELRPYLVDVLLYVRTKGQLLSREHLNFVKIGKYLFGKELEKWAT